MLTDDPVLRPALVVHPIEVARERRHLRRLGKPASRAPHDRHRRTRVGGQRPDPASRTRTGRTTRRARARAFVRSQTQQRSTSTNASVTSFDGRDDVGGHVVPRSRRQMRGRTRPFAPARRPAAPARPAARVIDGSARGGIDDNEAGERLRVSLGDAGTRGHDGGNAPADRFVHAQAVRLVARRMHEDIGGCQHRRRRRCGSRGIERVRRVRPLARCCIHASRSAPAPTTSRSTSHAGSAASPRQASNRTSNPLRRSPSAPMNTATRRVTDAERLARAARRSDVRGDPKVRWRRRRSRRRAGGTRSIL